MGENKKETTKKLKKNKKDEKNTTKETKKDDHNYLEHGGLRASETAT